MSFKCHFFFVPFIVLSSACGGVDQESSSLKRQATPALQVKQGYLGTARCVAEPTVVIRAKPSPAAADTGGRLSFNQVVEIEATHFDKDSGRTFAYVGTGWVDTRYLEKEQEAIPPSSTPAASKANCDRNHNKRYSARSFSNIATPAFLSVIAWAEGLGNCYHYTFNYKTFDSYANHPNIKVCAGSYCSTAAGRYQILNKTWNYIAVKYDLPSFDPVYQDDAAVALISEKSIDDLAEDYDYELFESRVKTLGSVWASLPESPYGQPTRSVEDAWEKYQKYLAD